MIDYVEDALALDEAYLTRAIAQEVFGMDKLAPESINADGGVAIWISDEQERAVLTGEYSRSMDAALGLLRSIGNQLNPDRRLRLLRSTATYLGQVLAVSDGDAGDARGVAAVPRVAVGDERDPEAARLKAAVQRDLTLEGAGLIPGAQRDALREEQGQARPLALNVHHGVPSSTGR